MSLRLRHIYLNVETEGGPYGASIPFVDGLVILRADNTSGKSTVIQSFIYALGLEGMLSASHDVPLPHVMTDSVRDGAKEFKVLSSYVTVEIENKKGETVAVTRWVKGTIDRHLIKVTFGRAVSKPQGTFSTKDFFVRQPFAAQSETGFHHWLAEWIGWKLPTVGKYDGSECPLYMECMFPFMLVEQKRGWAGIPARLPVHYRIRDVGKRAIEFLLALDVYDTTIQRLRLKEQSSDLRSEWKRLVARSDATVAPANGVVQGLPKEPVDRWPLSPAPVLTISRGGGWVSLSEAQRLDRTRLAELEKSEIPRVQQIADSATESLITSQVDLAETEFVISQLFEEIQIERNQLDSLQKRISTIEEDVRRNKDVRRLRKMGSNDNLDMSDATCPTCHQAIADSLLPIDFKQEPMTIDDNIAYLESQLETFIAVQSTSTNTLTAKERRLAAMRLHASTIREQIRSLKEALVSNGKEPSIAAIEERIRLRESVRMLKQIDDTFDLHLEEFQKLAQHWKNLQEQIALLPKGDLSKKDEQKLNDLEKLFTDTSQQFGVSSVHPTSLSISLESYKPVHDGFELEFDLSASDMVRVIWAYLVSLLEMARKHTTEHLGILVMDEPGQQQMKRVSLNELITRTSSSLKFGQQVILATSEEDQNLRSHLQGMPHSYLNFRGFIIKKLS